MTQSLWLKKAWETVPQMLYNSSTSQALSVKSTSRTSNTMTTGNWSPKWKRDSSHTLHRQWQRRVTDDTKSSRAAPCQQQNTMKGADRRHRLPQQSYNTTPQHQTCAVPTDSEHRPVANIDMAVVGLTEERWRIKMSWRSDDQMIQWTDNTWLTIDNWQLMIDNWR